MRARNNKPIAIDLFSGAGGLSEGFIQAGFHIAACVDIDHTAARTQKINHSFGKQYRTEVITEDIRDTSKAIGRLEALGINQVDAVIGGPPCQGFSRSNLQSRSRDNPLNWLFLNFVEVVKHYRPEIVVLENVGDLDRFDGGSMADGIVRRFRAVGYKTEKAILNAACFGVPQRRNRIFFVGSRRIDPIDFPSNGITDEADFLTVWDAISDLPLLDNGAMVDELSYRHGQAQNKYQKRMRAQSNGRIRNNLVTRNSNLVLERYRHIPQGSNWQDIPDQLMLNYSDKSRCHEWIYRRLREDEPSVAISNFRKNMLIHPRQDRGLSVREAARLQSFPDHFVFAGGIGSQQQQVANAVPPLLAKAVAKSVRAMLGK